jgi:ABC-type oligopeptide transport system ATPase subunit
MSIPLLEASHARKVYHGGGGLFSADTSETVAVDDFTLRIDGETPSFTTIAGESGSGKTTIARLLLGVTPPSSGRVLYRGMDITGLDKGQTRSFRQDVQAIFQDPFEVYNPFYKVDHILTTPIAKFGLASSASEAADRIDEALRTVGLRPEETLGRYPHQLSGGQRQRITIARALLLKPKLIIADEPVSMVDASLRATILSSLHRLHADFGISFLYITHDLTTAYQVSDRIVVLYHGTVAEAGGSSRSSVTRSTRTRGSSSTRSRCPIRAAPGLRKQSKRSRPPMSSRLARRNPPAAATRRAACTPATSAASCRRCTDSTTAASRRACSTTTTRCCRMAISPTCWRPPRGRCRRRPAPVDRSPSLRPVRAPRRRRSPASHGTRADRSGRPWPGRPARVRRPGRA